MGEAMQHMRIVIPQFFNPTATVEADGRPITGVRDLWIRANAQDSTKVFVFQPGRTVRELQPLQTEFEGRAELVVLVPLNDSVSSILEWLDSFDEVRTAGRLLYESVPQLALRVKRLE